MKTLFNLKTLLITVFICNLQSTIINPQSFNLYAQDPELFNHTWYFVNGELSGDEFLPTQNLVPTMNFFNDFIDVSYPFCSGGVTFEDIVYDSITFEIIGDYYVLVDECFFPDHENELLLMQKHDLFYGDLQNTGAINNPFSYIIEPVDTYLQLTITNGDGDWAVYNSVLLSTASFDATVFDIYPNPASDKLFIESQENISQVAVYDIHGKLIKTIRFNPENSVEIDVRHLQNSMYFLKIETENNRVATEKFIKN